jgi:hypothetical protein
MGIKISPSVPSYVLQTYVKEHHGKASKELGFIVFFTKEAIHLSSFSH